MQKGKYTGIKMISPADFFSLFASTWTRDLVCHTPNMTFFLAYYLWTGHGSFLGPIYDFWV
jgi:hypothetical protein